MSAPTVLIDSSIPLYALGTASDLRDSCRRVLTMLADQRLIGVASTEMIQEVVHHRLRMTGDPARAVLDARDVASLVTIVPFDETVLDTALDLIKSTGVRGRDAVHAATALIHHIPRIVSTDPAFDCVPGLARLDPLNI